VSKITTLGIDLAKNVFQLHGVSARFGVRDSVSGLRDSVSGGLTSVSQTPVIEPFVSRTAQD
jgi:hypothetical protein